MAREKGAARRVTGPVTPTDVTERVEITSRLLIRAPEFVEASQPRFSSCPPLPSPPSSSPADDYFLLTVSQGSFVSAPSAHTQLMATIARNPLSMRPHSQHHAVALSPYQGTTVPRRASGSGKRARSPDPTKDEGTSQGIKRLKAVAAPQPPALTSEDPREEARREKERKRAEREEEFRIKYSRAFPNWTFHFDLDTMSPEVATLKDNLERRVKHMGAVSTWLRPAWACH